MVDGRQMNGSRSMGILSPCEPNGSGEPKIATSLENLLLCVWEKLRRKIAVLICMQ